MKNQFKDSDEEIFDEFTKSNNLGNRLNLKTYKVNPAFLNLLKNYKTDAQKIINELQKECNAISPNPMPYVHFDFIDDSTINACAFKHKGREYIGMNIGAFWLLRDIFNRMLSSKDIFPEIGNLSKETGKSYKLPTIFDDTNELNAFFKSGKIEAAHPPKDPERAEYAALLTYFALHFIVCHEYGHLANGHLEFLDKINGIKLIIEMDNKRLPTVFTPLMNRTIEMNADAFAVARGMRRILNSAYPPNITFANSMKDTNVQELKKLEFLISAWSVSIWVFFSLLGSKRMDGNPSVEPRYPTPRQRQIISINTVHAFYEYKPYFDIEFITDIVANTILRAELNLSIIAGYKYNPAPILKTYSENKYITELLDEWKNNLRPHLEPVARWGLAQ